MPIGLDPNSTFQIVLECDAGKDEGERAYFEFRFATNREWKAITRLADRAEMAKGSDAAKVLEDIEDAVRLCLVDWGNMRDRSGESISYDPAELDALVNPQELMELLEGVLKNIRISTDAKKNSASQ